MLALSVPKPGEPKLIPPVAEGPIIVERSDPFKRGFSGPPTRDGSPLFAFSLLKVLHSDPTSITLIFEKYL